MNLLTKYYLLSLPPLAILIATSFFLPISNLSRVFIFIGFLWPYTLKAPGIEKKYEDPRYRFSFIRFALLIQSYLPPKRGISIFPAILFCGTLGIISKDYFSPLVLIGSGAYIIWEIYVDKKGFFKVDQDDL